MYFNKAKYPATALMFFSLFSSTAVFSGSMGNTESSLFKGHFLAQLGWYSGIQGSAQNIHIRENLIGDHYTVKTHNQGSGLVGLGYLLDGPVIQNRFPISYGVDAFFLGQTAVSGYIIEERQFTNLSYRYKLQNIPVYFAAKTLINTKNDNVKLAIDAGIGPNFISASRYFETALNEFTLLNNAFAKHETVAFSATVGASLRFNNAPGHLPIELGYRFFYLGEGRFRINNNQVINALKTGNNYANAFVCTVTL